MRRFNRLLLTATTALSLAAIGTGVAMAQDAVPAGDWRTINRDSASTRFPLDQINKGNVAKLKEAWRFQLKTFSTAVPLVVGGVMYVPAGSRILALDAETGAEKWSAVFERDPAQPFGGVSGRGVSWWPGDASTGPRIMAMMGSKMVALDAATGARVADFGTDGMIDIGVPYSGTPTIVGDVAVIGAATLENETGVPGNPRAYNLRTGKKIWEFQTVPVPGQKGHETWGEQGWWGRSGTNMWSFSAPVDVENGLVFLPIGSPAHNYWGGTRPGSNLFGNSIVAVDVATGEYRWHFQTVHHDIWDSDMPTAGTLVDVKVGGVTRQAIAHVGKTSLFYVLDRKTGEPIHDVEERPVPAGDVPGEYYHPTQPIPVKTPPLSRVTMTIDDIVTAKDTTPEHAQACKAMWDKAGGFFTQGLFTPFMHHAKDAAPKSSIQFPGGIGGVNWGGPASDPRTGTVFVNALDTSLVGWVEKVEGDKPYSFDASQAPAFDRASVDGKGPFFSFNAPISGQYDEKGRAVGTSAPCYKPPWARLTAVDANTGQIKWAVPLGSYEELPAGRQVLGNAGSAGPTATAGGLVFIGASNDKRFRAFDSATGKQLWEAALENNANANPMSYAGGSGKQFVAINAGGVIVAYALPANGN